MPQSSYTPIQHYRSTTPGAAPSAPNLTDGELGFNISDADMALYAKNASGTVKRVMNNPAGLKYPTADGSAANQVLKTDGAGNLAFLALTASRALVSDGTGGLGVSATTSTELGYVSGVTSAIQTQINTKAPSTSPTFTGTVVLPSTTSIGNVDATEISYLDGVTSAIQTQLNAKVAAVSSTDNAIVRFDGTGGAVQNSTCFIDDSGNMGVGTSSPGERLNVVGGGATSSTMNLTGGNNNDNATISSDYSLVFQVDANNNIGGRAYTWKYGGKGYSDGISMMTLDASGNLGLGVTPSANWTSAGSQKAIQIGAYAALSGSGVAGSYYQTVLGMNCVDHTTLTKYLNDGYATSYVQATGQHQWFTAPSGTAGNPITFTQAMTLNASGNLGVGTTSPAINSTGKTVHIHAGSGEWSLLHATTGESGAGGGDGTIVGQIGLDGYLFNYETGSLIFGTSSSERMRIDTSGNLGLGVTPSAWGSSYRALQNTSGFFSTDGNGANYTTIYGNNAYYSSANSRWEYYRSGNGASLYRQNNTTSGAAEHSWSIAPSGTAGNPITFTQAMTLDASGNLLVGGTTALYGSSGRGLIQVSGSTEALIGLGTTGNTGLGYLYHTGTNFEIANAQSGYLSLKTANTERMRLDASGNLGLGVTPSAWSSVYKAFSIGSSASISAATTNTAFDISNNSYNNGSSFIYKTTAAVALYEQLGAAHVWYTAPSGTAGNPITFTQAMTLDASGNLGVGTSSPGAKLDVNGSARFGSSVYLNGSGLGLSGIMEGYSTNYGAVAAWRTSPNDGINPYFQIVTSVNGITLVSDGSVYRSLIFKTGGADRMRLDASGNLLVGTTGLPIANAKLSVAESSGVSARFYSNSTDTTPAVALDKASTTNTTGQVFAMFTINNQTTGSGQINANGASQAAFGSFSDRRLKQNIVDLPSQLASILALRPVEFDYIESEGGGHQTSFIAQEFEEVYPDAIGERADGMKTLTGWGKTEARLVKAIQEQQAIINELKTRIEQLENK